MAFLRSSNWLALLVVAAMVASAEAQTRRVFTNPLLTFSYASNKDKLFAPVQKLQFDIRQINPFHQNFTAVVSQTAPSNALLDSMQQVKAFFDIVVANSEIAFYNATVLFSQVSQYHWAVFQNFSVNYDNALNLLNGLQNALTADEGSAVGDLIVIGDNVNSYITNFNASLNAANAVNNLISPAVNTNLTNDAVAVLKNLTATQAAYQDMYTKARVASKANRDTLMKNLTDQANMGVGLINATIGAYNGLIKNFTGRGPNETAKFQAAFNASCNPNEAILNETKAKLDEFNNYLAVVKLANNNWTRALFSQAQDNLGREFDRLKQEVMSLYQEFDSIFRGQGADINAWFTDLQATKTAIQNQLTRARNFAESQATFVTTRNNDMMNLPSLASPAQQFGDLVGVLGNMSLVVNGPNTTGLRNVVLANNTFTIIRSDPPQKYDLTFDDVLPPAPETSASLGPLPFFVDAATAAAYNVAPFQVSPVATNFSSDQCAGQNSAPFPAPYTAYPCFDKPYLDAGMNAMTPTIGGNWIAFVFNLDMYNFNTPPAVMVSVSAARMPDPTLILSTPLTFSANIPNPVGMTAAPIDAPPAATLNPTSNNGWNNFVFAYRVESAINAIEVHLMVSDIDLAMRAGLRATVTFLAP